MLTDHLSRGSEEEFVADVVRTGFWRSDTTEDPYAMRHPNADCRRTLEALAMLPDAADILPAGDTVQLDARGLRFITLPLCDHLPLCDARFLILTWKTVFILQAHLAKKTIKFGHLLSREK